jgi:hypothetical protein
VASRAVAVATVASAVGAVWLAGGVGGFMPLLWLVLLAGCLGLAPRRRRLLAAGWLLALLAVAALSWVVALDHELAFRHTFLLFAAVFLFALARHSPPDDALLGALAAATALASLTALWQVGGGLGAYRLELGELAPALRASAGARLATGRAFGTAALPGHFAILQVMVAPLLVERALRSRGLGRAPWWGLTALAVLGAVATRSVAAVGVGAVLLVAALLRRRSGRLTAGLAALLLVVVGVTVLSLRHDLADLEPLRLRLVNWRTTAWVALHHPFVGVGFGGVGQGGLLAPTGAANLSPYGHCTPLELCAETGLAGVGLVALGMWALVRLLRHAFPLEPGLVLAVAAAPLHNLVDFSLYTPGVLFPWVVLLGTLVGRHRPLPGRTLSAWLLVPVLSVGTLTATLAWRAEAELEAAVSRPPAEQAEAMLGASRWAPWEVTPVLMAAGLVPDGGATAAQAATIERTLAERAWVRPVSSAWAEAMARVKLGEGKPAEALPWVKEAERRAPWRGDLGNLETACAAGP